MPRITPAVLVLVLATTACSGVRRVAWSPLDAATVEGKKHHHQEVDRQILEGHVDKLWDRCAVPETSFQGRLSISATRVEALTVDGLAEPGRTCAMDWLKRIQFSDASQAYFVSFTARRQAPRTNPSPE